MLRVEYAGENVGWGFTPYGDAEGTPHVYVICLEAEPLFTTFVFVTRHEVELDDGVRGMCLEGLRDPTTNIRYKLTPIEEG